jgi:alcohol dehydrogenase
MCGCAGRCRAGAIPGLDYPRIPGHEVMGTIDGVGDQVQGWSIGERVGVGWFSGACGIV